MDRKTRYAFVDLAGCVMRDKRGHRAHWEPHKTTLGGVLHCSCGWKYHVYAGNIAGHSYGKMGAWQAFQRHFANKALKKDAGKDPRAS